MSTSKQHLICSLNVVILLRVTSTSKALHEQLMRITKQSMIVIANIKLSPCLIEHLYIIAS